MHALSCSLRSAVFSFAFAALAVGCPGPDPGDDSGVQDADSGISEADGGPAADAGTPDAGMEAPPVPPSGSFGWFAHDADDVLLERWAPAVADLGNGRALLFGGTDLDSFGGSPLDDVYRFDGRGAVPGFAPVELASDNPIDPPLKPSPRYCGCAAYDPVRNDVLVIGGRSLQSFFTDVWRLDLDTNTFSEVSGGPPAVLGCAITWHPGDDSFYLFGGASQSGSTNQLYRYTPDDDLWTNVAITSDAEPTARYDAWLGSDGARLLMAGGALNAQQDFHADVWSFDPGSGAWLQLAADGDGPLGRRYPWARLSNDGGRLVFGFGNNGGQVLADLWSYDVDEGSWTEHTLDPAPPARGWSPALPGGDGIIGYLMGGFDLGDPVADLWRLDADASDAQF